MARRRTALVCQHLENLSSELLADYAKLIRDLVNRRHGVYALYKRDKLYYVGLAKNLRSRVKAHLKDRHKGRWDRFSVYLTIDSNHMKELESLVIRITKPKGNRQGGRLASSENLVPVLKRKRRQMLREEESLLFTRRDRTIKNAGASKLKARAKDSPALAGHFPKATTLIATYKRKKYRARVRKNGTVRYAGKVYLSPSHAAEAIRKSPTNGWWFWHYERAPRQWVRLRELRRR